MKTYEERFNIGTLLICKSNIHYYALLNGYKRLNMGQ